MGSHLCKYLVNKKNFVICLDNLHTGNIKNIKNLKNNKNFKFVKKDILEKINLKIDEIYHLACPASPKNYQEDPVRTIKTNVLGTINMLDLAKKNKAKILLASTSEIYGEPMVHPQTENYWGNVNPIGNRSCYDEGKRCAETLFFDYYRQYKLKIKVVRIFNTYGPNMNVDDGRVVSNFVNQALKNKSIMVCGNGKQTRSFCYVDDLIIALCKMMNSKNSIKGPINIGNPDEFSIIDLAKKIVKMCKSSSIINFESLPLDDPTRRKPNIKKAKRFLGWQPKTNINEGLKKTIIYFSKINL